MLFKGGNEYITKLRLVVLDSNLKIHVWSVFDAGNNIFTMHYIALYILKMEVHSSTFYLFISVLLIIWLFVISFCSDG